MAATVDTHQHETGDKGLKAGRARLRLERGHRRRLHRAGLQPRGQPRVGRGRVGLQAPAIMLLAFVPMLFIASAYYYLNRADPDCGTTFSWVTRAMGPHVGWMGGWGIIAADVIVMANLAQIAGQYSFYLVGADSLAASKWWSLAAGVIWIVVMTWICYVGIEASAKTQWFLLGAEVIMLGIFAVVALGKVYFADPPGAITPSLSWINPFDIRALPPLPTGSSWRCSSTGAGTAPSPSTRRPRTPTQTPGKAALARTVILVAALRRRLGRRPGLPRSRVPGQQLR